MRDGDFGAFSEQQSRGLSDAEGKAEDLLGLIEDLLDRVVEGLRGLVQPEPALQNEICLAVLDDSSARLLAGRERPLVIVRARGEARLAHGICNGLPSIGLFLPYTPLHWLVIWELLGHPAGLDWLSTATDLALVATSANVAGEPIVIDGIEARGRLAGIAGQTGGDVQSDHRQAVGVDLLDPARIRGP